MNSIRTPKKGTNATSRRIAEAVDDEDWQKFRLSLKGLSTRDKLDKLQAYYNSAVHTHTVEEFPNATLTSGRGDCDACIRVDNYIKALCRGGQLWPRESLLSMIGFNWKPTIKS